MYTSNIFDQQIMTGWESLATDEKDRDGTKICFKMKAHQIDTHERNVNTKPGHIRYKSTKKVAKGWDNLMSDVGNGIISMLTKINQASAITESNQMPTITPHYQTSSTWWKPKWRGGSKKIKSLVNRVKQITQIKKDPSNKNVDLNKKDKSSGLWNTTG